MENSYLQFCQCRKVTTHKCAYINVNENGISTLVIMKNLKNGCHFGNINHTEKFQITNPPKVWVSGLPSVNRNTISPLAIMKKLKNGHYFVNIDCTEKFQITGPPKVWVSSFPSVNGNGKSVLAITKKLKKWLQFYKYWLYRKISNYWPPQSLGLRFSKCWWKRNISIGHYEKIEK